MEGPGYDNDVHFTCRTQNPNEIYFEKKRGANGYHIFAMKGGYDVTKKPHEQMAMWDVWLKEILFERLEEEYKDSSEVHCFRKGDDCDSEEDD